jgi:hypothetical protein
MSHRVIAGLPDRRRCAIVIAVPLVVLMGCGDGGGGGGDVQRLERSTVLITSVDQNGQPTSIGSGSIVSQDGLILTNAHVASPAAAGQGLAKGVPNEAQDPAALVIGVFRSEDEPVRQKYTAKVLAVDGYLDVAVLRIDRTINGVPVRRGELKLPAVPLGDSDALQNGEDLTVIGFPGIGGGFDGSIDVVEGNVAGFEQDERVPDRRGWIKTDAEISSGNSGGLAADADGRLVGIPTIVSFDQSGLGTTKGKLRPIKLAMPILNAAREGQEHKSPYFVEGTGREKAEFQGWAAAAPTTGCAYQPVQSYPNGANALIPVWSVDGLAKGEDLRYLWVHFENSQDQEPEIVSHYPDTWRFPGTGSGCYYLGYPPQGAGPVKDGDYVVQLLAGPNLTVIGRAGVTVGGTGPSQPLRFAPPSTGAEPGAGVKICENWSPANILTTGVDLDDARLPNGEPVAEAGIAELIEPIGNPAGYGTAAEADQVAAGSVSDIFGHSKYRWIVIQHQGRFYAFNAVRYEPAFVGEDEVVVNPEPPPCRILSSQGVVVAWHALRFISSTGQLVRYDWSQGSGGRFSVVPQ